MSSSSSSSSSTQVAVSKPLKEGQCAPEALFITSVEEMSKKAGSPLDLIRLLEELFQKYTLMEKHFSQQVLSHGQRLPEVEQLLESLTLLKSKADSKEPLEVQYELASTIYANAVIDEPKTILLWLGADTLVEYEIGEAIEMLQEQLTTTRNLINQLSADLTYLQDQKNTTKVNIARTHNYNVALRKQKANK